MVESRPTGKRYIDHGKVDFDGKPIERIETVELDTGIKHYPADPDKYDLIAVHMGGLEGTRFLVRRKDKT